MEAAAAKRLRKNHLERIILSSAALTGVVALAVAAPNMLKLLKHADLEWAQKRDPRQRIAETAAKLKKKGLIVWEERTGGRYMRLTSKGQRYMQRLSEGQVSIRQPRKWDGRWRIIIFDISERHRSLRDRLRRTVVALGFYQLQKSVWVHPYDCEDVIAMIKMDMRVGRSLLYIIADAIEHDARLREHFGLAKS